MTFPVEFHLFGFHLHPHPVLEVIAYAGGSQFYFLLRRRSKRDTPLPIEPNLWLLVGCVFGALFGAKLLAIAESWGEYHAAIQQGNALALLGGKTIVGGLLGGWIGVEIAKKLLGVSRSTGDVFVFPLILAIAVGRVGCFLTGLADHTHGTATSLPWAIDFGDGVPRHPTQLYEILWLAGLGVVLIGLRRKSFSAEPGRLFRFFMLGYLAFRFGVEFIKPSTKPVLGLSAIQCACLLASIVCILQLLRSSRALFMEVSGAENASSLAKPSTAGGDA